LKSEEKQDMFAGVTLIETKALGPKGRVHPNLVISPSRAHNILLTMMRGERHGE